MEIETAKFHNCKYCDYRTAHSATLKIHIQSVHLKMTDYIREKCDKKFSQPSDLKTHVDSKHKGIRYSCDQCDYWAKQFGCLERHINLVHLNIKNYNCGQCDYRATHLGDLKKHVKSVHLKISCSRKKHHAYSHSSNLNRHVESKYNGIRYSCEQCDFRTMRLNDLNWHKKSVHHIIKIYNCEKCDAMLSSSFSLKRHDNAMHKGVRYSCDHCNYKATQLGNLKTHIKAVHLKVKNYHCEDCEYRTPLLSTLKRHVNTVHLKKEQMWGV